MAVGLNPFHHFVEIALKTADPKVSKTRPRVLPSDLRGDLRDKDG
jgi:hypothetical protein